MRCRIFGHHMVPYSVGWQKELYPGESVPQVYLNDRCLRCHEYRNPLIGERQELVLRHQATAVELWGKESQ
jgi:hypothetical protein